MLLLFENLLKIFSWKYLFSRNYFLLTHLDLINSIERNHSNKSEFLPVELTENNANEEDCRCKESVGLKMRNKSMCEENERILD